MNKTPRKTEPKAEIEPELAGEPTAEPESEPVTDPKAESKTDPKAESKTEPKAESKTEPKAESKTRRKGKGKFVKTSVYLDIGAHARFCGLAASLQKERAILGGELITKAIQGVRLSIGPWEKGKTNPDDDAGDEAA
jgi:hypothetical protein